VTFERFDVVRVPFPFADKQAVRNRPALVLSAKQAFNDPTGHVVLAMITSHGNPPWAGDCPVTDQVSAGLPVPSKVRFKVFTLDQALIRGRLGRLSELDRQAVMDVERQILA